jgi:hypothetical protein
MITSLPQKRNTSILSSAEYERIQRGSRPPVVDNSAELERMRMSATHEHTLSVTETWANSIVNERKARITRLEREAQQREDALRAIDDDERKFQKAKRKEALKRAEEQGFEGRPEIRAVHAQMLLHEVNRERQRQLLLQERHRNIEHVREDEYAASERRKFEEAEARERELQEQKRLRALEVAEGVRQQKIDAEERKRMAREDERAQESLLADEAARLVYEDRLAEIRQRELAEAHVRDVAAANSQMVAWKERQAEIQRMEDERITAQKYALDEAMEARQAEELKRRQTRQADIDRMIARQQQTLSEINAQRTEFGDRQYDRQYEKERREIEELREKQERLAKERRNEYLESRAKIEAERQRKREKPKFPPDETTIRQEEAIWEREQERARAVKDLAEFQRQQAAEKKEREDAEKERKKLEFNRHLELDDMRTQEAEEYARRLLIEAKARRKKT